MRQFLFSILLLLLVASCTSVDNGERGVVYKPYNGGLDAKKTYDEGVYFGLSWFWNDMITYTVRQQTMDIKVSLLDKNSMAVGMSASIMLRPIPEKIGFLHEEKGEDYLKTYCQPVAEGVLKDVVGSYSASELVTSDRQEAQTKIKQMLIDLYAKNHISCDDVIIRDIDLPKKIVDAITAKQVQDENNLLSEKKKLQEENLAAAAIAKAKGEAEVKILGAAAESKYIREIQSALAQSPQYVELKKVEQWDGTFGTNNVFGDGMPFINVMQRGK